MLSLVLAIHNNKQVKLYICLAYLGVTISYKGLVLNPFIVSLRCHL